MADLFVPADVHLPPAPTPTDLDFAQRFQYIADALESAPRPEQATLLLSTCRNAFLLVNAIFTDVQRVTGYSTVGPRLRRATVCLREGGLTEATKVLKEIDLALDEGRKKFTVWQEREEIYQEFMASIPPGLAKAYVLRIVENGIDLRDQLGRRWSSKFHRLALADEPRLRPHLVALRSSLDELQSASDFLRRILEVLQSFNASETLRSQLTRIRDKSDGAEDAARLFDAGAIAMESKTAAEQRHEELEQKLADALLQLEAAWGQLTNLLRKPPRELGLSSVVRDGTVIVSGTSGEGLDLTFPSAPDAASLPMLSHELPRVVEPILESVRTRLTSAFEPNLGFAPMPPPFKVNLVPPKAVQTSGWKDYSVVTFDVGDHRTGSPDVRVALLRWAIPSAWYVPTTLEFDRDGDQRIVETVQAVALAAVREASSAGARLVVFPEFFLPTDSVDAVTAVTEELDIVLVSGLEASRWRHRLVNECLIAIPGEGRFLQRKQRPSIYEPPEGAFFADEELHVFRSSRLGTFAVLVCSDYLELDILSELARSTPDLDNLIVVARTPYPELFVSAAKIDTERFYANIIMANTWDAARDGLTHAHDGTLLTTPERDLGLGRLERAEVRVLAVSGHADEQPIPDIAEASLLIVDAPIEDLVGRHGRKPRHGFLNAPFSRHGSPGD